MSNRSSGFESWRTQRFSPWNYFTGGSGNLVAPESASGRDSGLYTTVVGPTLKNCWFAVYRPRKLEVGQSVGFFFLYIYIDLCMASTES